MSVGKVGKPRMSSRLMVALTGFIVGAVHMGPALAGSFTVNPVNIDLPANRKAASLTVTNSGAAPVSVRIQTFAWTQRRRAPGTRPRSSSRNSSETEARASPIEPPFRAVGQDAPSKFPAWEIIDPAEVTQHLGRRRGHFIAPRCSIQRPRPSLAFDHRQPVRIAPPLIALSIRGGLRFGISEQRPIRHIITARDGEILLAKRFRPSQRGENRPNGIVFCLTLVGPVILREGGGNSS